MALITTTSDITEGNTALEYLHPNTPSSDSMLDHAKEYDLVEIQRNI